MGNSSKERQAEQMETGVGRNQGTSVEVCISQIFYFLYLKKLAVWGETAPPRASQLLKMAQCSARSPPFRPNQPIPSPCPPDTPFLKRFYVFERKRERDRESAQAGGRGRGEGEADSPLSREPDGGLDPRTPGS